VHNETPSLGSSRWGLIVNDPARLAPEFVIAVADALPASQRVPTETMKALAQVFVIA